MAALNKGLHLKILLALLNSCPMEFRVANLPKVGFHWGFVENERSGFNRGKF